MKFEKSDSFNQNGLDYEWIITESLKSDPFLNAGIAKVDTQIDKFFKVNPKAKVYKVRCTLSSSMDNPPEYRYKPNDVNKSLKKSIKVGNSKTVLQSLKKSWSSMELAANLNGLDLTSAAQSKIAKYIRIERQHRIIASLVGITKDSINNHDSDFVIDISKESNHKESNPLNKTNDQMNHLLNHAAVQKADAFLKNFNDQLRTILIHPYVLSDFKKLGHVDTIHTPEDDYLLCNRTRYKLIKDDGLLIENSLLNDPSALNNSAEIPKAYYTFILGPDAISLGYDTSKTLFEIENDPVANNDHTVSSKMEWIIYFHGYDFKLEKSPSLEELRAPLNWTRMGERKNIPLSVIISKV
jgi:hypothetical protein